MTSPMPLAYFPSPPQGVWHLGPLPIRAYALFIIAGIVVALLIGDRRWEARGGERGVIYDIALWAVPFGLLGGRLYHLATDWRTYWGPGGAGFGAALRIWDGGLGIWGAVALGGVGAWIACRRRGIPLPAFGDAIAPGIILAQAIGRLGNYFNQELYGRETTLPWGLEIFYRRDPSGYVDPHSLDGVSTGQVAFIVQPTFLYELIWNLLVFAVLIYVDRRFSLGHGRLFALYVAGYCIGRFGVELLRDDTATHIAGIRINSFTSTFVFIGAMVYFISAPKGREDPASLRGNQGDVEVSPITEEAAAAAAADEAEAEEPTVAAETVPATDGAEPETVAAEATDIDASEPEPEAEHESPAEAMEPDAAPSEIDEPEMDEAEVDEAEVDEAEVDEAADDSEPAPDEPEPAEDMEPEGADPEQTESDEPAAGEPETAGSEAAEEEPAEPTAEQTEPDAAEAEPEDLDVEAAESEPGEAEGPAAGSESDETESDETESDETEADEPEAAEAESDTDAGADDTSEAAEADTATGPGAEPGESSAEPPTGGDEQTPRRRWGLRRRNRR